MSWRLRVVCLPWGLESCRYGGTVGVTFSELGPDNSGDRSSMPSEAMSFWSQRSDEQRRGRLLAGTESSRSSEEQPGGWWSLLLVQHQQRLVGSLERAVLCDRLRPLSGDPAAGSESKYHTPLWNLVWKSNMEVEWLLQTCCFDCCSARSSIGVKTSNLTVKNVWDFGETQLEIISVATPFIATRCHCSTVDHIFH